MSDDSEKETNKKKLESPKKKQIEQVIVRRSNPKKITVSFTKTQLVIGLLVVALAVSIFTGGFGFGSDSGSGTDSVVAAGDGDTQPTPSPSPAPSLPTERVTVSTDDDPVTGDEDAPVTIIEFSDFECPFCARFYTQTLPEIQSNYIDTGKAKLILRDLPLPFHPNAQIAAEATECADEQGLFWEMHNAIFEDQTAITADDLKAKAAEIGVDTDDFDSCLDNNDFAEEVQADYADAQAAGASGTPTFFIGNDEDGYVKLVGAQPFATFQAAIDAELE